MANLRDTYIFWLVVFIILKYSMWKSTGKIIPYIMENKKCSKLQTSYIYIIILYNYIIVWYVYVRIIYIFFK